ncbi:family 16 glycosylhydrolase [Microvirga sp. M2]|uniref:family 16 glycosylhydrolase n=1 Tax=Microvirga sp. M2 TaxID=3073270 RepID=UPI0039C36B57
MSLISDTGDRALHHALSSDRETSSRSFLERPATYAVGAPVLSALGAGTTLLAPMLLDPASFGAFVLLSVICQCSSLCDLGLAPLGDRILAKDGTLAQDTVEDLIQTRWLIALGMGVVLFPAVALAAFVGGLFTGWDAALAIVAGLAMMIANGRVVAFRTASQIRAFTTSALILQAGLTLPRLAGLLLAGVSGCFAVLVLWYGACAVAMAKPRRLTREQARTAVDLLRRGLPLFAFSGFWLAYTFASRWISATLSSPHDFGLFAFGSSFSFVAIGLLGTVAQVRYPAIIRAFHHSPETAPQLLVRDITWLAGVLTLAVVAAALCGRTVLAFAFPAFVDAYAAAVATAASCIPLGVAAWILPVAVAFSPRPMRDSCRLFGPALAAVVAGMVVGNAIDGIVGQAWAVAAASSLLAAMLLRYMRRIGVLQDPASVILLKAAFPLAGVGIAAVCAARPVHGAAASESMPPDGWSLAFSDEFDELDLSNDRSGPYRSGTWEPHYPWGARTNNKELEFYVDPRPGKDPASLTALGPFSIDDGKLLIRANPVPAAHRAAAQGQPYSSGLLTTARSFAFQYGYVEIRARIPAGQGLWPALWLIPLDQSWPPEIDIMETLGHRTGEYWATLYGGPKARPDKSTTLVRTPDLAADFHMFGVKWTAKDVTWFFDGKAVAQAPTPVNMHKPMYIVVNLAVGGEWPGAPDHTTAFPAEFAIDYVRAFTPPTEKHDKETIR